jgi:hypothetical protein
VRRSCQKLNRQKRRKEGKKESNPKAKKKLREVDVKEI